MPDEVIEVFVSETPREIVEIPGTTVKEVVTGAKVDLTDRIAGEALHGHRVVSFHSDGLLYETHHTSLTDVYAAVGVAIGASLQGALADVRTYGVLTEPSWNWAAGPIYLGAEGVLTQTPPSSGYLLEVGCAISPTSMFVNIKLPIKMS